MLKNLFEEHGKVKKVNIIKDQFTGAPRGFAFVEMEVASEAKSAIDALNGHELEGKKLTVNEARPREAGNRSSRPNGDRGGFGGNGHRRDDRSRSRF